ncbi:hypothetical protein D9M73_220960 [compost metagenome]
MADAGHGVDLEVAGRACVGVAGLGLGFGDVAEDLLAAQQVALAGLGEGDAAGGAVQQAGAQVGFELGDGARDVGGGEVHALGGGGEAAGLGDTDEGTHVVQEIHDRLWRRTTDCRMFQNVDCYPARQQSIALPSAYPSSGRLLESPSPAASGPPAVPCLAPFSAPPSISR